MSPRLLRVVRVLAAGLALALPPWAWAQDFGFKPPRDPDDPAAVEVMRDLAQRIVPVYKDADTAVFLANVSALQIVSGAHVAAYDSSRALLRLFNGKPFDATMERAQVDAIYAHARAVEAREHAGFAKAFVHSFEEQLPALDNAQAEAVMKRLQAPLAGYREPVRRAFDRWRGKDALPQADAIALVRSWLDYESRRSFAVLLPELIAAESRARYAVVEEVRIAVGDDAVINARVVRPGRAKGALTTLLRFTLDPGEDDAQRSAFKGYAGVTAFARGRTIDGAGAAWPFEHEAEDTKAVIEWIARQPWSDGRVAMLGDGYSGYAAWAAARGRPPALKAIATIAPMAPGIDFPMAGQIYRNSMLRWVQEQANAVRPPGNAAEADARWRALDALWYAGDFPYWNIDGALIDDFSPLVRTWLTHPSFDLYWRKLWPTPQELAQIDIPMLTIAGYYGAEAGALHYWREQRMHRPQADSTLLLGPWDAVSIRSGSAPTLRGYPLDVAARVDLPELRHQWLDHVLRGEKKPALLKDRVNWQVMGSNAWRHAPALDAANTAPLRLYLDTRQRNGPHRLLASPPAAGGGARLTVDLADRSDADTPWPDAVRANELPLRNALAFVGDAVAKETVIEGSLRGRFEITPSRQDVDLSVSLYERTSSGEYLLLFEPYDFRASYAGHRTSRRLLRAGERQTVSFGSERITSRRIAAGSRLVLLVGINKRPDRQINFGSGKDVNSESIPDAQGEPMRLRWHEGSYVEIGGGVSQP